MSRAAWIPGFAHLLSEISEAVKRAACSPGFGQKARERRSLEEASLRHRITRERKHSDSAYFSSSQDRDRSTEKYAIFQFAPAAKHASRTALACAIRLSTYNPLSAKKRCLHQAMLRHGLSLHSCPKPRPKLKDELNAAALNP